MVLEKTVSPYDIERVVIDTFGECSISLVVANSTIVLTRAPVSHGVTDITKASENALAKDWLLPEEDEAWGFLRKNLSSNTKSAHLPIAN